MLIKWIDWGRYLAFVCMDKGRILAKFKSSSRTVHCTIFIFVQWKQVTSSGGTEPNGPSVQVHSPLQIGEKLHNPLWTINRRSYERLCYYIFLRSLKKCYKSNERQYYNIWHRYHNPVFNMVPRLPIVSTKLSTWKKKIKVLAPAQAQFGAIDTEEILITNVLPLNIFSVPSKL